MNPHGQKEITCCQDCWHHLTGRWGQSGECIWYLRPINLPREQWCEHWNEDQTQTARSN